MAGVENNNPLPQGVSILKCANDDKTYVVNEILNFYQRKMRVLGAGAVKKYSHHIFDHEKLYEARRILQELWTWRNLEPIPNHAAEVKKLMEPRQSRRINVRLALDIIEFLEKEGPRLDVCFLTMHCEEIPSKVHERDVLQNVYTLLEKSEFEYTEIIDIIQEKQTAINANTRMLEEIRADMTAGFSGIAEMLQNMQSPNMNSVERISSTVEEISDRVQAINLNEVSVNEILNLPAEVGNLGPVGSAVDEAAAVMPAATAAAAVTPMPSAAAAVTPTSAVAAAGTPVAALNLLSGVLHDVSHISDISDDELEITDDNSEYDSAVYMSYANMFIAGQAPTDSNDVVNHLRTELTRAPIIPNDPVNPLRTELPRAPIIPIDPVNPLRTGMPRASTGTNVPNDTVNQLRPGSSNQPSARGQSNQGHTANLQNKKYTEFLIKKNKRAYIRDEGGEDIPFSAIQETFRFKAFISKISPNEDIGLINSHINRKLGVNANLKVVSQPGAPALSIILDCTTNTDSLNLRMPGLWPKGTCIVKWRPPPSFNHNPRQAANGTGQASGQNQHGRYGRQYNVNSNRSSTPQNVDVGSNYVHRYPDQQRLNQQWRD